MNLSSVISCLVLINSPELVRGFAVPSADRLELSTLRARQVFNEVDVEMNQDAHHTIFANDECQEPGRRRLFAAMVGAASLVALSEIASASTETSVLPSEERFRPTSRAVATTAAPANNSIGREETVAKPPIDTRAILDKAAKKALGGKTTC